MKPVLHLTAMLLLVGPAIAQAGVIYTDAAAFELAVAALDVSWSEDFEGFPFGPVADPFPIAGGQAEIQDGGNAFVFTDEVPSPTADKKWLQAVGTEAMVFIQGPGATSLSVTALRFEYFPELAGAWNFNHSAGEDLGAISPSAPDSFVGWVGNTGETLNFANFTATQGMFLDNIVAYTDTAPAPEPATVSLLVIGLGVGFARRRMR